MTALSIQSPFPTITDIDGQPLEDGYIWIGVANLPPIGNPIAVYWDAALTQPAALPVRTRGGYPVNAGTPARLYVNSDYSIQVQNRNGSVVYSAPQATERLSADLVTFIQAGSGAVVRTAQSKMRDVVSVKDFGAVGDGVTDDTVAFTNAQGAGNRLVLVPAGTYKLNNMRLKTGVVFQGEGYTNTIIQQANTANPAIYGLADATTGQLISCGLLKLRVKGLGTVGASAVKLEATAPYVVSFGDYDYHAENVSTALEIVVASANEVYSNKFNIYCLGAASTAFVTEGVYNEYRLESVLCASGKMLEDTSLKSTFYYCVGDGTFEFNGQMCVAINPTVETIAAAAAYDNCAIRIGGFDNTLINPVVAEVEASKAPNAFNIFNKHVLINPRIIGTNKPNFPFVFSTLGSSTTLIGGDSVSPNKIEAYTNLATVRNLNLVGDVSSYSLKVNGNYPGSSYVAGTTYTVDSLLTASGLDSVIVIGSSGTCTITLPSGANQIGRELTIVSRVAQTVQSSSADVVPPTGGPGTAILPASIGEWARMRYDGTNWTIVANK